MIAFLPKETRWDWSESYYKVERSRIKWAKEWFNSIKLIMSTHPAEELGSRVKRSIMLRVIQSIKVHSEQESLKGEISDVPLSDEHYLAKLGEAVHKRNTRPDGDINLWLELWDAVADTKTPNFESAAKLERLLKECDEHYSLTSTQTYIASWACNEVSVDKFSKFVRAFAPFDPTEKELDFPRLGDKSWSATGCVRGETCNVAKCA